MADIWTHPELGMFELDIEIWDCRTQLPQFSYFPIVGDEVLIQFYVHKEFGKDAPCPTDAQAQALLDVIANAESLAPKIVEMLWADILGQGPGSGMWWHGELEEINCWVGVTLDEMILDEESLRKSLELCVITVNAESDGAEVEIVFHTDWETEHGVGVLVKDGEILGFGYGGETEAFGWDK